MSKKLLPTVIGVILTGGVTLAQADVQLFGRIDESLNYINGGKIDGSNKNISKYVARGDTNTQLVCNDCEIGVKGSEDLGNGLQALFKLAWQYDINGGTDGGLTGRDQWIGLGGNFGKLQAGTMSTVYKEYGSDVDPVYTTVAQGKNIGLQSHLHSGRGDQGEGRATNTIGYASPTWKGLGFDATYTIIPDSEYPPAHDNPYSVGVKYENGGLFAAVAYLNNGAGGDDSATQVSAKYDFDRFGVFGQYEFDGGLITDDRTGTLGQKNSGDGADVWFVGADYTMGNNMLYAAYGQGDNARTTDNTADNPTPPPDTITVNVSEPKYKAWEIVGIHHFSKRTMAYLAYVGVDPDSSDVDSLAQYALGFQHRF
jgi:predicted porin